MRARRQIINPQQQPSKRHYQRDREQYRRDEERDFYNGVDYIKRDPYYSYRNSNPHHLREEDQGHYEGSYYTPSSGYGYERDEYYPIDPLHHHYRSSEAVGYG